jgi:uncharacterized protein involved in type VI secretion and phage assembly
MQDNVHSLEHTLEIRNPENMPVLMYGEEQRQFITRLMAAETIFLSTEGKTRRVKSHKRRITENLKDKYLET